MCPCVTHTHSPTGIDRLRFGDDGIAIKEMISAEKESVPMGKNLAARGAVERWLSDVEERMMVALSQADADVSDPAPFPTGSGALIRARWPAGLTARSPACADAT